MEFFKSLFGGSSAKPAAATTPEPAAEDVPSDLPRYTLAEVAKHQTDADCWVAVKGKVYNVSSYLMSHPGGRDILFDVAGQDATIDFESVGHGPAAYTAMKPLLVGVVA
eukprot:EG_transcript_30891